jgi:hypothetical protein
MSSKIYPSIRSLTRWTAKFKNQREVQAILQQAKEVTRASAPETVTFHGTAPASFSGHEAAAPSLPEAGGFGGLRAQQMMRERGRDIGRGQRMDGGDEDARVVVRGGRQADGKREAMFFFFLLYFFLYVLKRQEKVLDIFFILFILERKIGDDKAARADYPKGYGYVKCMYQWYCIVMQ